LGGRDRPPRLRPRDRGILLDQGPGTPRSGRPDVLINIQALRGVAAFLVVFVHLETLASLAGAGPDTFVFGNSGVDLFFVISGLIMVVTTAGPDASAGRFMAHRIGRIVPLYWTMTLFVFAVAVVAPSLMQATRADPADLVRSLLFIPFEKANGLTQPIVFVGWTLNYEMAFYLLFALGLLARHRLLGLALTASILLTAVLAGVVARPTDTLGRFYTSPIVLEFALGMALGLALPLLRPVAWMTRASYPLALISFALLIAGPSVWPDVDRFFVFGLPAAILVACALVMERSGVTVASPLIRRLGDASYSTYLTHFFVTQAATKAALALGVAGIWQVSLAIVATFVMVGAMGLVVHTIIEKPMSRAARRWLASSPNGPKRVVAPIAAKAP